jgi:hypothetical protein
MCRRGVGVVDDPFRITDGFDRPSRLDVDSVGIAQ